MHKEYKTQVHDSFVEALYEECRGKAGGKLPEGTNVWSLNDAVFFVTRLLVFAYVIQ